MSFEELKVLLAFRHKVLILVNSCESMDRLIECVIDGMSYSV